MDQFEKLPPRIRACALVGMFLQEWALMESRLRTIIGKGLGLDAPQSAILSANMQLRDKIHTARTIVSLTSFARKDAREHYDKVLKEIAQYSGNRNLMAHDAFVETEDGKSVSFFVIKAKGSFSVPEEIWDMPRFEAAFQKISGFYDELEKLEDEIVTASLITAYVKSRSLHTNPLIGGLFGSGVMGPLSSQLQNDLDADLAPSSDEPHSQNQLDQEE